MSQRKSDKAKEGRCQGIGSTYVPFHKVNEARSIGTATMVPDPFEGRHIHLLSQAEADLYYTLRWNPMVLHFREQFLLDGDLINVARKQLGLRPVTELYYTTDLLVDYTDGRRIAFSVKSSKREFDPNDIQYKGREQSYARLIRRQNIERVYWESQSVSFFIVTRDSLDLTFARNVRFVMGYWDGSFCQTREQKMMWLVAHRIIEVPMRGEYLNPKKLAISASFDVEAMFAANYGRG